MDAHTRNAARMSAAATRIAARLCAARWVARLMSGCHWLARVAFVRSLQLEPSFSLAQCGPTCVKRGDFDPHPKTYPIRPLVSSNTSKLKPTTWLQDSGKSEALLRQWHLGTNNRLLPL